MERATLWPEMEPQDDSLTNDELAAKVETMERTCELLDEQLAAMRAAESALQSRGAATAKATTVARHATARVEHLQSESSALQHRCSTLLDQLQQLQAHGPASASPRPLTAALALRLQGHEPAADSSAAPPSPPPLTATVADALALTAAADGRRSPLPPPPLPPQFGELWSHAAAADALALERLSDPTYPRLSTPREHVLISELSKKSQQAFSLREELRALRAQHESATSELQQAQALLTSLGTERDELSARLQAEQREAQAAAQRAREEAERRAAEGEASRRAAVDTALTPTLTLTLALALTLTLTLARRRSPRRSSCRRSARARATPCSGATCAGAPSC